MGGGLESRGVGRVYGVDGAVRHHPHRTHELRSGSQDHHPSKTSVQSIESKFNPHFQICKEESKFSGGRGFNRCWV